MSDHISLIVKGTRACNLRCGYCYVKPSAVNEKESRMSDETLENMIRKFTSSRFKHVSFVWHGGEPLLISQEFYELAIRIQEDCKTQNGELEINNSLQSNVTLLDQKKLDFFTKLGISPGTSCDGPAYLHDASRPFVSGEGSYAQVRRGLELLKTQKDKKGKERNVGTLCVITKNNASKAEEIYRHFKELGLSSFGILPYKSRERPDLALSNKQFFDFHRTIYDLWVEDDQPFSRITPLSDIVTHFIGGKSSVCSYKGNCFEDILSVNVDGSVYLCAGLDVPEWSLGNVNTHSVDEMLSSGTYLKALELREKAKADCSSSCDYYPACNSGCREIAYLYTGDLSARDPFCAGRKRLFDYIANDLSTRLKPAVLVQPDVSVVA